MKTLILVILFILLLIGVGWYFTKNPTDQNSPNFSAENLGGQATTTQKFSNENLGEQTSSTTENLKNINNTNQAKNMNATIHTNLGDITIKFNENTPNTVENFIKLAQSDFYNGTKFHRVIKGFMNQGGDPLTKDDSQMARWGMGGPGYKFNDEITPTNDNKVGSISMANAGPNTNGSQFFINVADNSFLNTKHTVFGQVTEGMDVVMKINNVQTGTADRPIEPVIINSITIK